MNTFIRMVGWLLVSCMPIVANCAKSPPRSSFVLDDIERVAMLSSEDYGRVRAKAASGSGYDEYLVGLAYLSGYHEERAPDVASTWFEKASAQGITQADVALGIVLQDGIGMSSNYQRALLLFTKAANLGNADAMFRLGLMNESGQGVDRDLVKARRWYEQAAALGSADAQYNLGVMAEKGTGGGQDFALALKNYRAASVQGDVKATTNLAELYETGRGAAKNGLLAAQLYECAIGDGDNTAAYDLADMYLRGDGVSQDVDKAVSFLRDAVMRGDGHSAYVLGRLYLDGREVAPDHRNSLMWLNVAEKLHYSVRPADFSNAETGLTDDEITVAQQDSYAVLNDEIRARASGATGFRRNKTLAACVQTLFGLSNP